MKQGAAGGFNDADALKTFFSLSHKVLTHEVRILKRSFDAFSGMKGFNHPRPMKSQRTLDRTSGSFKHKSLTSGFSKGGINKACIVDSG